MIPEDIAEYTNQLNHEPTDEMQALTDFARKNGVPIMQLEAMAIVEQCVRMKKPKNILEIGTAIGWSAIKMAKAARDPVFITTIERDPKMAESARNNINQFQLEEAIEVLEGDALELKETLEDRGPFDMIIIDAGKGHYQEFFNRFLPHLNSDGLIICDNVYFRGFARDPELAPKRLKRLAQKMQDFNTWLSNHQDFTTVFVPVGDGLSISTQR